MSFSLHDFVEFIGNKNILEVKNFKNTKVEKISANSKDISENSLFIAINGVNFNGELSISDAIKQGASVVFSENLDEETKNSNPNITFFRVKNARLLYSLSQEFLVHTKIEDLKYLAVTGTNGKTTTAYIFYQLLNKLNQKSGLISTVKYDDGATLSDSIQTTPDPKTLFNLFEKMALNQVEYVPMEISSHSLAQFRIGKIKFNSAIFTNLTGDHLDFHLNMESYYLVKKSLFINHLKDDGYAIINIDDEYGLRLSNELKVLNLKVITFGKNQEADFQIKLLDSDDICSKFSLNCYNFTSNLLGEYNIYNLVGVIISLIKESFQIANLQTLIANETLTIPGRLQLIKLNNQAKVFIDYAHTDDALKNVLNNLKKLSHNRIITVFGCGGNRDKSKRERMGDVAFDNSDYTIVTSDNPRDENPMDIIADITKNLGNYRDNQYKNLEIIENRSLAIKRALDISKKGDIVLIAGKGHENYQEINGVKLHFDDAEEVDRYLQENR